MLESVLAAEFTSKRTKTQRRCCAAIAEIGKEAAVFLPSGTMCNEIAIQVHTKPGDEVICERSCHLINFETGGPAAISGVMSPIDGAFGIYEPDQLREAIRPPSRYAARENRQYGRRYGLATREIERCG